MWLIAVCVIGGVLLLFGGLSFIGFLTPVSDDPESAASGVVHHV